MRRLPIIAILCILAATTAVAQRSFIPRPEVPQHRPAFDFFSSKAATSDSTRVDLYIAVPYSYLEFLYAVDKYVATYAVGVQVTDKEHLIVDQYQMFSAVEGNSQHRDRMNSHVEHADAEQMSFALWPGKTYQLRLTIRDLTSRREMDTTLEFTVKDFTNSKPAMSDILLYRSRHGMRIVPAIGGDVSVLNDQAGIFAQLYNVPSNTALGLVTEVFNTKNGEITNERIALRSTSIIETPAVKDSAYTAPPVTTLPLFQSISFKDLWTGEYRLRTYVLPSALDTALTDPRDLNTRALTWSERPITVRGFRGIPIATSDLDEAIEQLQLIATGSEWDSLSIASTAKEKRDAILDFWHKRNPQRDAIDNRPMQVFYARVEYANEHFSSGFQPGWKSDRGRVYIALGSPDYVDSHPYEAMQQPYEVWQYSRFHASYRFVDQYMLGDYRLVGVGPLNGTFVWDQ